MSSGTPSLSEQAGFHTAPGVKTEPWNEDFSPASGAPSLYRPPVLEEATGCGSTVVRGLGAFTDTKVGEGDWDLLLQSGVQDDVERNPALSARIDDDFSTCRTPLQVLQVSIFLLFPLLVLPALSLTPPVLYVLSCHVTCPMPVPPLPPARTC